MEACVSYFIPKFKILPFIVLTLFVTTSLIAQETIAPDFLEKAKKNENWKKAFITGEQEQIVFMNISLQTNPENEIGEEIHTFDQAILIVEGRAQCVLNDTKSKVQSGDLIFVPRGTRHNVINLEKNKPLKIVSFYSETDMPANTTYKTKQDQPKE